MEKVRKRRKEPASSKSNATSWGNRKACTKTKYSSRGILESQGDWLEMPGPDKIIVLQNNFEKIELRRIFPYGIKSQV